MLIITVTTFLPSQNFKPGVFVANCYFYLFIFFCKKSKKHAMLNDFDFKFKLLK